MAELPTAQDVVVEDNDASAVVLFPDGAWEPTEVPPAYHGNSYHLTFSGGAGVNFTFTGEWVWVFLDFNYDHGPYTISLDGGPEMLSSSYSPTQTKSQLVFARAVEPGTHVLTLKNIVDQKVLGIDYFMYRPISNHTNTSTTNNSTPTHNTAGAAQEQSQQGKAPSEGLDVGWYIAIVLGVHFVALLVVARERANVEWGQSLGVSWRSLNSRILPAAALVVGQDGRSDVSGGTQPARIAADVDAGRRLHNQLNTPGLFDTAPIIPDFDLVGPGSWDAESVATTRAGSTRPPPHPHTTPRHAMQASVEDAPPSGLTSARPSPLHSGAILESKRNSGMETVQEEPVAGPSTFPPVVLSVEAPEGNPSLSRPASTRRAGSSGRSANEQLHQDGGWPEFDAHAPGGSGWDDFGGGGGPDAWPGGFSVGNAAGGSGWPEDPPPLASGLGLSGATASQQGSRRPSDASLYVQDPNQPRTPSRSRAHSRVPSGSGVSNMARSPPGAAAPSLAPAHVRSPTLSDVHGANVFHVPVGSPPLNAASPPRPLPIPTNITPARSSASRSVRPTPIARDYALPEGQRTIPLAADGTPRFPPHGMPVPAGISTPNRALRDAMFMGNGTPRHPAAARQAQPPSPPVPEQEPEPPQEPPQEEEPVVPGKKSFLSKVSSMLNRDRAVQKDKPPAPRKVKKKKGKAAVEEMLAEEWPPEAGPSNLGDAPPAPEHDPAEEERKKAEEEEAHRKAEEEEKRRKEEADAALKASEEALRLEIEARRRREEQDQEERRQRDEEEEGLARQRAEAVEAEHAQVLSQHGDAHPTDPPAAVGEEQVVDEGKGGGGWGLFKRRGTKKLKKGAQKPPTPPPPEPSPFNLPPLPTDAPPPGAPSPPPAAPVLPSPQRTFAAPPSPIRTYQQSPRPTLDTTVHGHAPTLIEFSGMPHEEHREYVYVPSNATPTPGHHRGASTMHAVPAQGTRRSPTQMYAATAATQTPRLPSTYTMPFPHSHGPGRAPLPRVASGASGAMSFRVPPPRSPTGTVHAPGTPSVPSAQLLAEHAKILGALDGAEAARERAFLQNEERRARLFDEAEDRRRQEAESRRRVIEVWM
ncbi:hypothetical protein AURDEDRAFT_179543 [Auricularia subglabra TFB-10046 SS5]|nr:hypothetical protein AURDEDRAFT_179543 [Auricularia subglabra TFB-10046 SS5]